MSVSRPKKAECFRYSHEKSIRLAMTREYFPRNFSTLELMAQDSDFLLRDGKPNRDRRQS